MTRTRRIIIAAAAFAAVAAATADAQTQPLQASFDYDPASPHPGDVVHLRDTTTGGSATTPRQYAWDLDDDGAFDDATTADTQVTFASEGGHRVRLRVRQPSTAGTIESVADRAITVTVVPPQPAPTETTTPTQTAPPQATPSPAPADGNQPPVARYDRRCHTTPDRRRGGSADARPARCRDPGAGPGRPAAGHARHAGRPAHRDPLT